MNPNQFTICTLFFAFCQLSIANCFSQEADTIDLQQHKLFRNNIIKLGPSLGGENFFKGALLSYETGIGIRKISLNLSVRYFSGFDSTEAVRPTPEHLTFEIHPRYWFMSYMKGPFLSPLLVAYYNHNTSDLYFAPGFASGLQVWVKKHFSFDILAGLQTSNKIEQYDSPVFFRIIAHTGWRF